MILPPYIQQWHDYVKNEPTKHCKAIKALAKLIEKLLKKKKLSMTTAMLKPLNIFVNFSGTKRASGQGYLLN